MNIRIAGEIPESIVDGPGIRYVVFTQGCPHHCVGCHNPETHDFTKGNLIDVDEICSHFTKHPYMSGLTISGGEPFSQKSAILSLIKGFKSIYPKKSILIYTGYTFEQLQAANDYEINEILSLADYLVDGPFIISKRDISLIFRGSSNQRIIDLKKTIATNQIVTKEF